MENIKRFKIDTHQELILLVPALELKTNYFYPITKELSQFDKVTMIYKNMNQELVIGKDALQHLLSEIYVTIKLLLKKELLVPNKLKGYVGLQWDKDTIAQEKASYGHREFEKHIVGVNNCLLMSCPGENIYALMYNIGDKYFIEISPGFPWVFGEGSDIESEDPAPNYIPFEEYEKNYKPLVVAELNKKTLLDWKKRCEDIFDQVGPSVKY